MGLRHTGVPRILFKYISIHIYVYTYIYIYIYIYIFMCIYICLLFIYFLRYCLIYHISIMLPLQLIPSWAEYPSTPSWDVAAPRRRAGVSPITLSGRQLAISKNHISHQDKYVFYEEIQYNRLSSMAYLIPILICHFIYQISNIIG